jgi:putative FmdB family regulatory protein
MPIYDFTCRECREPFEKLVRGDADIATLTCPKCSSSKVEKLISLPAKPLHSAPAMSTSCGQGPPCGAPWCGRQG